MGCIKSSIFIKINSILKILPIFFIGFNIFNILSVNNLYAVNNEDNFRLAKNIDTKLTYLDAQSLEYINNKKQNTNNTSTEQETGIISEENTENPPGINQETSNKTDDTTDDEEIGAEEKYDDPYETYNRAMHIINKQIDTYLIKPIAEFYSHMVPPPVQYMVGNFFENLQDVSVIINDFLQGEYYQVPKSFNRFFINSTFGIFGLIDIADDIELPKRRNDFGITFGKWSMADSSYFVIPVLGPSTVRDTIGMGFGMATNLTFYLSGDYVMYGTALNMIDQRANLLPLEKVVDTMSDDEYIFVRNAYLQYRTALINGENPDVKKEDKESELLEDILSNETSSSETDELRDLEPLGPLEPLEPLAPLEPLDTIKR